MTRRGRGDGTVYFDEAKGRWIGAVTVAGRRRKVTATTKTDARRRLNELLAAKTTGAPIADRQVTISTILDDFLDRDLPNRMSGGRPLAETTVARHRWAAGHIARELGKARVVEVDVRAIEAMLDRLTRPNPNVTRPMNRASLAKVLSTLQLAFDFAVDRGYAVANPARSATLTPDAARSKRRSALAPDQARRFLAALDDHRLGALYALQLLIGLRPGEAAALHWGDIDGAVVNVARGIRVIDNRPIVVDELKTDAARRAIEMPADLVAILEAHRRRQVAERLAAERWADDRLVFTTTMGTALSPSNVRRDLHQLCDKLGIARLAPNELRHSCASLLSDRGVPNELIADLLGHTTTRMVEATYRHRLRPVVSVAATTNLASAP